MAKLALVALFVATTVLPIGCKAERQVASKAAPRARHERGRGTKVWAKPTATLEAVAEGRLRTAGAPNLLMLRPGLLLARHFRVPVAGASVRGALYAASPPEAERGVSTTLDVIVSICRGSREGQLGDVAATRLCKTSVRMACGELAQLTRKKGLVVRRTPFLVTCAVKANVDYWLVLESGWGPSYSEANRLRWYFGPPVSLIAIPSKSEFTWERVFARLPPLEAMGHTSEWPGDHALPYVFASELAVLGNDFPRSSP